LAVCNFATLAHCNISNIGTLQHWHFATLALSTLALCNIRNIGSLALCNIGTLHFWHFATLALCNFGTLQLWHLAILALCNIGTFQIWNFAILENQSLHISMHAFTHLSVPRTCFKAQPQLFLKTMFDI
jgi:hypothetical protein